MTADRSAAWGSLLRCCAAALLLVRVAAVGAAASKKELAGGRLMRRVLADGHIAAAGSALAAIGPREAEEAPERDFSASAAAMRGSFGLSRDRQRDMHISMAVDGDGEVAPPEADRIRVGEPLRGEAQAAAAKPRPAEIADEPMAGRARRGGPGVAATAAGAGAAEADGDDDDQADGQAAQGGTNRDADGDDNDDQRQAGEAVQADNKKGSAESGGDDDDDDDGKKDGDDDAQADNKKGSAESGGDDDDDDGKKDGDDDTQADNKKGSAESGDDDDDDDDGKKDGDDDAQAKLAEKAAKRKKPPKAKGAAPKANVALAAAAPGAGAAKAKAKAAPKADKKGSAESGDDDDDDDDGKKDGDDDAQADGGGRAAGAGNGGEEEKAEESDRKEQAGGGTTEDEKGADNNDDQDDKAGEDRGEVADEDGGTGGGGKAGGGQEAKALVTRNEPDHKDDGDEDEDDDGADEEGSLLEHELGPAGNFSGKFNTSEEALAAMGLEDANDLWKHVEEYDETSVSNGTAGKWECSARETKLTEDGGGDMTKFEQHELSCGEEFLSEWHLTRGGTANQMQFRYKCCEADSAANTCSTKHTDWKSGEHGHLMALKHHQIACDGDTGLTGWKLQTNGNNIRVEFRCCKLPKGMKFGTCKDSETKPKPLRSNARELIYHQTTCDSGEVLTGWKMDVLEDTSKFNLQRTCCPVGTVAELGPERMCWWVGDPHFKTFDGVRHDPVHLGKGRFYWVAKSDFVQIQSYYEGFQNNRPALTRGVAFGGKFLGGHKLIVSWEMRRYKNQEPQYRRVPHIKFSHTYDGKPITFTNGHAPKDIIPKINFRKQNHWCWLTTVGLPLNVYAAIQSCHGFTNNWLKMREMPGGQDGHCGNNDGQADRQRWNVERQKNYPTFQVKNEENMFTGATPGLSQDTTGKTIDDCKGEARERAEAACRKKFSGGKHKEQFIKMCIFDVCFTKDDEEAEEDEYAEEEDEKQEELQREREYTFVAKRRSRRWARRVCGRKDGQMVRIRSPGEQRVAMEALSVKAKRASKLVWIGGRKRRGEWRWDDGDKIYGFTNWKSDAEAKSRQRYLCIERETGKWVGCSRRGRRSQLCASKRHYGPLSAVEPVEARTVCGSGKQLAMPKNLQEMTAVREAAIDAVTDLVYLGARYMPDGWQWDDGTPMGGAFTYWDKKQPDMSQKDHKSLFLCANGFSGRWRVCPGYDQKLAAVCETAHATKGCPMGKVSTAALKLSKNPGEQFAEFGDECWYLGMGTEDCTTTCARQIGGVCSQEGLAAGNHPDSCKMILQAFGNIGDTNSSVAPSKEAGCTYVDDGKTTKVLVEGDDDTKPTCSAKVSSIKQHRVCSCKAISVKPYPKDYIMTDGDAIRVSCGVGMPKERSGIVDGQDVLFSKKKGISLTGDKITKTERSGWISGGIGTRKVSGEGVGVTWQVQTSKRYMVGLQSAAKNVRYSYADLDFGLYSDFTNCRIYESGTYKKQCGRIKDGQSLQVRISNDKKVEFVVDGEVRYTSTKAPTYPLVASTAMFDNGGVIEDLKWFALPPPDMQQPFDVTLVQGNAEDSLKLRVVPQNATASWIRGKENVSETVGWPVEGTGRDNIDIVASVSPGGEDTWSVVVSGTTIPDLEVERSDEEITAVTVDGPKRKPKATLYHPEVMEAASDVSMNSKNGVLQHGVSLTDAEEVTIAFEATLGKVSGTSCVRCEDTALSKGTHLLMVDGHLILDAVNATPRRAAFSDFTFNAQQKYSVQLAYMSLQKWVELWVDGKKVGTVKYTKAGPLDFDKGFLGGHIDDELPIAGRIRKFSIKENVQFRLKAGLEFCTHYKCPEGGKLKEFACDIQCGDSECGDADREACCDKR